MTIGDGIVVNGRYRLGPVIGRGGMSEVHDGYDLRLERPVAVKLPRTEHVDDPRLGRRFEATAAATAQLANPRVVEIFDVGESGGRPYLAMERLTGESLAHQLLAGPLDQDQARQLAADLLDALAAAHGHGILHGNIKPSNVLFSADGRTKVTDFGAASLVAGESPNQQGEPAADDLTMGTPAYLAPERVRGLPASPRSDLWSVGVVLYEALAGVKPYADESSRAVADAIMHDQPVPLHRWRPELDHDLLGTITRAMEKKPEQRFASAAEMAAAIGTSLTGSLRPTSENLASSAAFETGAITEETPRLEQVRRRAVHGPIRRLLTAAGAKPGWRASLLGGAAVVVGVLAICVVLVAQLMTSSGEGRGSANSGTTVPATTAPTTTPPTTAVVTSPATTAGITTPTTGRINPTTAPVIASPTPLSSQSATPPPTSTTTSLPRTTTTAPPAPSPITTPIPPR